MPPRTKTDRPSSDQGTTPSDRVRELRALVEAFAANTPIDPANGEQAKLYFPFHEQQDGPRGADPVADMFSTIELSPTAAQTQLFSGFQGSGKSTELKRLAAELRAAGFDVLFVEGSRYINLTQPLEISDLLLSVASAVAEEMKQRLKKDPLRSSLLERVSAFLSRIRFAGIDLKLGGSAQAPDGTTVDVELARLNVELTKNPSFKTRVQDSARGRIQDLATAFAIFMKEIAGILGATEKGSCPVLIVDDLEKVQGSGPQQSVVMVQIEQIFHEFHWALKLDSFHTVWTSPPYLPFLNASIPLRYDGYVTLPMIRLWDESSKERSPDPDALAVMRKFLRRRGGPAVDSLALDSLLDEVVFASSGNLRVLFRMMQDLARMVFRQEDRTRLLREPEVRRIIDSYVDLAQKAIYTDDHAYLQRVAKTRRAETTADDNVKRVAKLIDTNLVMIYRNGREWYDVSYPVQRLLASIEEPRAEG